MFRSEMADEYPPGYIESQSHRLLLGRMGEPGELAATAVWPAGGYVTGQTIVVDGGLAITERFCLG
jgi:NAD(P)-dependent dehydrogenase (short-subunit alcohol dehydrogenase family)